MTFTGFFLPRDQGDAVRTKGCALLGLARFLLLAVALATPVLCVAVERRTAASAVPIIFWNRTITLQKAELAGMSAQERAGRAVERLNDLPLNVSISEVIARPVKVESQEGVVFVCRGQVLFFLGVNDLDQESGETLEQASQAVLRNLGATLQARIEERSWPVVRDAIIFTAVGLLLLISFCSVIWRAHSRFIAFARERQFAFASGMRLFGFDFLPYIVAIVYSLVRTSAWVLTLIAVYLWVALSLRRFPYTQPWGYEAGSYVLQLLGQMGSALLHALPEILALTVIFTLARWLIRLGNALFEQIADGRITVYWMDADVAKATQRIFTAIAWVFAIIVAYPYIPGSQTDAFKGISVFVGLVVSLGSTGIINQVMSGLFVVYSKALKTGEWVKVNETEGEVLDVGLLAAKIRTIEGQEVTIPNSVLVGTSTMNFTRLGPPDGMLVSPTVTIGYDAPWRQVHALLLRAADRTPNVRKQPAPYVLQRQLSDFYVQYTLIARLEDEKRRIETISDLNSQIQDAFNEFGVQIMSPHYLVQPQDKVVIPSAKWHEPPAEPKS
jgi:small-conductance mechanosensitive channel